MGLHNACSFFSLTPGLWFFQKESTALLLEDMSGFWPSEHRELCSSYCLICKLSLLPSFSAPCPTSVPCCTFVPKAMTGIQTSVSECGGGAGGHLSGLGRGLGGPFTLYVCSLPVICFHVHVPPSFCVLCASKSPASLGSGSQTTLLSLWFSNLICFKTILSFPPSKIC